jgi:hypothetical protein
MQRHWAAHSKKYRCRARIAIFCLVMSGTSLTVAIEDWFPPFQSFQAFNRYAPFITGINPFQSFQAFHCFALFQSFHTVSLTGNFHVSRIPETSKELQNIVEAIQFDRHR